MIGEGVKSARGSRLETHGNRPLYYLVRDNVVATDDLDGSLTGNDGPVRLAGYKYPGVDLSAHYIPGTGAFALPLDGNEPSIGYPVVDFPLIDDFVYGDSSGYGWSGPWLEVGGTLNVKTDFQSVMPGRDFPTGHGRPSFRYSYFGGADDPDERTYREGSLQGLEAATLRLWYRTPGFDLENSSRVEVAGDTAFVEVRLPGGSWESIAALTGEVHVWTELELDLPVAALHGDFALGFRVKSDKPRDALEVDMITVEARGGQITDRPESDGEQGPEPFRLYPNPARDHFVVEGLTAAAGAVRVELFDVVGRLVGTQRFADPTRFAVATDYLARGTYVVRVSQGESPAWVERVSLR